MQFFLSFLHTRRRKGEVKLFLLPELPEEWHLCIWTTGATSISLVLYPSIFCLIISISSSSNQCFSSICLFWSHSCYSLTYFIPSCFQIPCILFCMRAVLSLARFVLTEQISGKILLVFMAVIFVSVLKFICATKSYGEMKKKCLANHQYTPHSLRKSTLYLSV